MDGLWAVSHAVLWGLVIVLLVGMVAMGREIGLLHRRLPPTGARGGAAGPRVGEEVPVLEEVTIEGRPITISGRAKNELLVFMSPDCSACIELARPLRSIVKSESDDFSVVVIGSGDRDSVREFARISKLSSLPVVASHELGVAWDINVTPYAVAIDRLGVVRAKGLTNHLEHLQSLIDAVRRSEREGSEVPDVLDVTVA